MEQIAQRPLNIYSGNYHFAVSFSSLCIWITSLLCWLLAFNQMRRNKVGSGIIWEREVKTRMKERRQYLGRHGSWQNPFGSSCLSHSCFSCTLNTLAWDKYLFGQTSVVCWTKELSCGAPLFLQLEGRCGEERRQQEKQWSQQSWELPCKGVFNLFPTRQTTVSWMTNPSASTPHTEQTELFAGRQEHFYLESIKSVLLISSYPLEMFILHWLSQSYTKKK